MSAPFQQAPRFPNKEGSPAAFHRRRRHVALALCCTAFLGAYGSVASAADDLSPPKVLEEGPVVCPATLLPGADKTVALRVIVEPDGRVSSAEPESESEGALSSAAAGAVRAWRFAPAKRGDTALRAKVRVLVRLACPPQDFGTVTTSTTTSAQSRTPPWTGAASTAVATPAPAPTQVTIVGDRPAPRSASDKIVKREAIAATPHRTANDVLLVVPGLFLTQHSGEGKAYQIFLRGFDAVHGQDLEIWAGGAPVNDVSNIHGQGYADLHFLMPEVIQEVRATPGTYDPRQGDFAVAGTVRMRLGYAEPGLTLRGSLGSFGARRAFIAYRPMQESEQTFAAFEAYQTEGFGPSRAAQRASTVGQLTRNLGQDCQVRVLLSSYAGRFDSAGVVRLDDLESGRMGRFDTYDPRQGGQSTRTQAVVELSDRSGPSSWSLSPYLVRRSMLLRSDFTGYLVDPAQGDLNQQLNEATTLGATGHYRKPLRLLSKNDRVELGFSGRSDWIAQSQRRLSWADDSVTASLVDATVRASNLAGYTDVALYPLDRVGLRGGVRVDALSYAVEDQAGAAAGEARSSQGARASKRASLTVGLGRGFTLLGSYGEGFRSPQARSLSAGQSTPFTTVSSQEVGLRWSAGDQLETSLAGYRTHLNDDLVFDHATGRNERVPATVRYGAAFDLASRPATWLLSRASFTYTRATFEASDATHQKGALLPYVPQIVARTELALTPSLGQILHRTLRAHVGVSSTLLARRPLPYSEFGHDVLQLDATARLRASELELCLDAYNLLDRVWYDGEFVYASNFQHNGTASLVPARHVSVGAPRTLMLTLSLYL